MSDKVEKVIIVGSGPAGHTSAIYAGRALLEPIVYEGLMAGGVAAGGQLTTTTEVENYPGFPKGITGPELMMAMREQSINCGAKVITKTVDSVNLNTHPFTITVQSESLLTQTLIIATGATAKRLHVPGEKNLWQKGISACAVCDGGLPIFRDKHLFVVGGGDTACEEATFLAKFASKVTMLVRKGEMRASKIMQERVLDHPKINVLWQTVLEDVLGENSVNAVTVKNVQNNEKSTLDAGGLFYAIGHEPNTEFLNNQVALDETGYIVTTPGTTLTSIPGVFACGDVQDKKYRQAVSAAGSGCMAAMDAEHFLATL
ncbi:MAG: thioredoxin-disulfide reductase [Candidatus Margulisbacteria bacterium]|nr:thioredoxin-disulfide reductase [Candidatus Margulisiibacteriota bacterium]